MNLTKIESIVLQYLKVGYEESVLEKTSFTIPYGELVDLVSKFLRVENGVKETNEIMNKLENNDYIYTYFNSENKLEVIVLQGD